MRESKIEKRLREKIESLGGECWKWESPGKRGVPDRIIILPGGMVAFAETKAPGKTEGAQQEYRARVLRDVYGCKVFSTVDSFEKVDAIAEWAKELMSNQVRTS